MKFVAQRRRLIVQRDLLLIEIERRCSMPDCDTRTRIGLTKEEARAYCGFECEHCETWNGDALAEKDVPDWWEELKVTGLNEVREHERAEPYEPSETVKRMSDAYRREPSHTDDVGEDSF
jgi:hypothetical protein